MFTKLVKVKNHFLRIFHQILIASYCNKFFLNPCPGFFSNQTIFGCFIKL